ncbi:MAG: ABC transporter ATP-binding protein [Ruminococcus sp.]|nr:ABC transporter ATP-binding protein [Ruminococcus sp.]
MHITAKGVSKSYAKGSRTIEALKPTDIELHSGRLTVIFGRSGSGKTTLMNILAGLLKPTAGSVFFDDTDIYSLTDGELSQRRSKEVGYIPQGQSGLSMLTVRENILLPTAVIGSESARQRVDELLRTLGLTKLAGAYPNELSGGELRRLAIARALINSPQMICADEPTNDLDDENTRLIFELLKNTAEEGAAVVVVTHDSAAEEFADIVYRMDGGELKQASPLSPF